MNNSDHRIRHDDHDRSTLQGVPGQYPGASTAGSVHKHEAPDNIRPEFNLLVAGCRGGQSPNFQFRPGVSCERESCKSVAQHGLVVMKLRGSVLNADRSVCARISVVSQRVTKDQLASVAKFVQGCSGHTSYIRAASIDILLDDGTGQHQPLGLTLIDTPSLDFRDEVAADRILTETLRHIDSRFAEGLDDEWKAQSGDRYVHLCIYFLDPDQIVPPSVPGPPAPLIPRTRTNSFSQPDHEPVILEPPVTTNPLLARPTLPQADIAAIRRLSGRVNVLPVIARADILSNDRLAAVKLAIRRDLADAGIGFGIFDTDSTPYPQDERPNSANRPDSSNGYGHGPNGASAANSTPPTSPTSPPLLRLPYALISPDMYSHSDGVSRRTLSRHELVQQYTPSTHYSIPSPYPRGKFIRSYRWGTLDVLDSAHSDFLSLRAAIFHHMETLQRYTRLYLFEKFRSEYTLQRPTSRHSSNISHLSHIPTMQHTSRPILAIDTAPQPLAHPRSITVQQQPPQQQQQRHDGYPGDVRSAPPPRTNLPESIPASSAGRAAMATRKLKCDGGRPTCGQCLKRNNPCDYMPQNKRRGTQRQRKGDESGSDSGDERSAEADEPSLSPEIPSQTPSRRSSNVGRHQHEGYTPSLPSMSTMSERRDDSSAASSSRLKVDSASMGESSRRYFPDNEVPHIATLPMTEPPTPAPMSAPNLPPIRPASDLQAAQRKRAATVPGKIGRQSTSSGPKVVACNYCRARKTKCDGAHPACASCARRQLDCNYVHESAYSNGPGQKKSRRSSTSKPDSPRSVSPPSSRMIPTPSTGNDLHDSRDVEMHFGDEVDLKRPMEHGDISRAPKKMRMDNHPAPAGIP
ncbi:Septin-like protein spn3 [Psilocybe cubensis]|uniref:Septin-like protein spn3 n=1 Tax=Psilocybe cubensis TaxID=181762 RepID=A0ACB8GY03_PSICU|nr:Septin-like protein spn3 [Psilocybe cubensis]KAH9480403.1 Septin-like protein spn3 [Psilocybe cubensis]